jgi:hypothetical protein
MTTTGFNSRWGRAKSYKSMKMGWCATCSKLMHFIGFRCIHCKGVLPRAKRPRP